jgi:hypothetical protein
MLPVICDLKPYRGDSWSQTFRLKRDGTPVNLTGATVESEARLANDAATTPLVVTIADAASGLITLRLPVGGLPVGGYVYDVEVAEPGGTITTWIRGRLTVTRDVTNELP